MKKKVMLSGIQPSGDLTLGSYLGAIKTGPSAQMRSTATTMADMHTLTVRQNPADLRRRTMGSWPSTSPADWTRRKHSVHPEPRALARPAELGAQLLHTMFGELSR